ncbi:MAG: serine/threonine protein kinase [Planctomycetaceae bacterium]|nr:MAG: serine/threonine protein kinase [Planctomycetaceae bacterium]
MTRPTASSRASVSSATRTRPRPAARHLGRLTALGCLGFALCLTAAALTCAADPWPAFRGPTQDGIAGDARLPLQWDQKTNVRWRTELPGQGWSSPVIGDGVIYLSAAIPRDDDPDGDYDLSLILIDAESGETLRVTELIRQDGEEAPKIHKKNSHASPTPLLVGDRLYVHFGHQGTACVDRRGELIWVNREHTYPPVHGNGGSPVLVGDALIFTCDGASDPYVVALDAATGEEKWRTPRPVEATKKFSFATPTVIDSADGPLVIAPGSDCVLALEPQTGAIRWWVRFDGYSVVPKPVISHSRVLIATGFGPTKLLAIRTDGSGEVTESHVDWEIDRGIPKTPSLIAHEGLVYLVSDDGIALGIDGESGEVIWRNRLGGNFSASPILAGDRIYFPSEEGITTVLRTGRKFEKLAANDLEEAMLASPAVAGNALFLRTDKALYRIEEPNGGSK